MHASKLFSRAGALSALCLVAAKPDVNVYFGQFGTDTLASYCESNGFDSVTLAFLSASPETDPATNYPATNFGTHCGASVYVANDTASRLLSGCTALSSDIQYCQQRGKKVLLSTGGIWGPDPAHNYDVTTEANGEYFAEFIWNAFGPYNASWTGPRPFDTGSEAPTVLDGFDFDIEAQFVAQLGYIALLKRLRAYIDSHNGASRDKKIIITGAPQCPLADGWSQMRDLITATKFDKLWVRFYNNNICQAGTANFNYDDWETFISNTASKDALLYVGLPASLDVTGHMSSTEANALVDRLKGRPSFGGVMVWDVTIAKGNALDGIPLYEAIHSHMEQNASSTSVVPTPTIVSSPSGHGNSTFYTTNGTMYPTASSFATGVGGNLTTSNTWPSNTTGTVFATATCASTSNAMASSHAISTPFSNGMTGTIPPLPSRTFSLVASAPRSLAPCTIRVLGVLVAMVVVTAKVI